MIVYAFLASTFIFLVAGIVFVFKGFRSDESEQKVVPISNLQAIEDLKDVPQSEKNVDDRSSLAKHLLDENLANPQTSSDQSALSEQSEHEIIKAKQSSSHHTHTCSRFLIRYRLSFTVFKRFAHLINLKLEVFTYLLQA